MRKKRKSSQQCYLALLGPTSIKAARKMLVKLSPDVCSHQDDPTKFFRFLRNKTFWSFLPIWHLQASFRLEIGGTELEDPMNPNSEKKYRNGYFSNSIWYFVAIQIIYSLPILLHKSILPKFFSALKNFLSFKLGKDYIPKIRPNCFVKQNCE